MTEFILTGADLSLRQLYLLAVDKQIPVSIQPAAIQQIQSAREVVDWSIENCVPVYGLTTGLGSKASESLTSAQISAFSWQAIQGRAHAIGDPLSAEYVRAAMLVRLNSFLLGRSTVSLEIVSYLQACINAGFSPVIGETGSIGAGDLCLTATLSLAIMGEGLAFDDNQQPNSAAGVLKSLHLTPPILSPGDGMALMNHSSFSVAMSAFAVARAIKYLSLQNHIAAVSLEAFRGNLSPLDDELLGEKDSPQWRTAQAIKQLLKGSELMNTDAARRLQDPLSLRNILQVHSALQTTTDFAETTVNALLNSSTDNPQVLSASKKIVSTGAYHTPQLTVCCEAVARALEQVVVMQVARIAKLVSEKMTGLPQYLAPEEANANGFAPVLKIAESLLGEIQQLLAPVRLWPSINADGVEDHLTQTPLRAKTLVSALDKCTQLSSIELMISTEMLEHRMSDCVLAPAVVVSMESVRQQVKRLGKDRPLSSDIERLAVCLQNGLLHTK